MNSEQDTPQEDNDNNEDYAADEPLASTDLYGNHAADEQEHDPADIPDESESREADALFARIEQLEGELAQSKDQMLRALADSENTRRRAAKERGDLNKYAIMNFARDLLAVEDNFSRALDAVTPELKDGNEQLTAVLDGIEATGRELAKSFEKHGINKLEPQEGEKFDPNFHEVMFEVPATGKPPGAIMQVIETGYMIHDRLLRPARVGVAKDDGSYQGENPAPGHTLDTEA